MRQDKTLEELWRSAESAVEVFEPRSIRKLPPVARRYLSHALVPGSRLSTCARIQMSGMIKLDSDWCDFTAEQVLNWSRGFVWSARAWVKNLPVSGFDRLVDGEGAMRWKLLGLFPMMTAAGAEITRSAKGRLHAEVIWLPAVLLNSEVHWSDHSESETVASFETHGEPSRLHLKVAPNGALRSCHLSRWGDLETGLFAYHPFGGFCEEERTIEGISIPTRIRVGWQFGTPEFETEGEFFRCTVTQIQYR